MLKLIGACLVILSSTGIGLYFSNVTKGRLCDLKDLKKNMFILRGDIHYGNTPLPEAIEALAARNNDNFKQFFAGIAKELRKLDGLTFTAIWDKGIHKYLKESYLSPTDRSQLSKLGETLGYLDKEMQIRTIDLYIEQLETELDEAIGSVKEKTRLYNMLGVLFGIFITIVMI